MPITKKKYVYKCPFCEKWHFIIRKNDRWYLECNNLNSKSEISTKGMQAMETVLKAIGARYTEVFPKVKWKTDFISEPIYNGKGVFDYIIKKNKCGDFTSYVWSKYRLRWEEIATCAYLVNAKRSCQVHFEKRTGQFRNHDKQKVDK